MFVLPDQGDQILLLRTDTPEEYEVSVAQSNLFSKRTLIVQRHKSAQCYPYSGEHGISAIVGKGMDSQVLLDRGEEQFHLLSGFVGIRNRTGRGSEIAWFVDWLSFNSAVPFFRFSLPFPVDSGDIETVKRNRIAGSNRVVCYRSDRLAVVP